LGFEGAGELGVLDHEPVFDLTQSLQLVIAEHDPPPRDGLPTRPSMPDRGNISKYDLIGRLRESR
jgi:hypothetical protein